ncbi:hypothetical protein [Hymenobacter siberiensis]|uniref:hypothetical protein n=1 Tax=Hymenobacter siberiensis TaxID=2848396 RepID=UPI001C1DF24A|nr:hypothetical protein [Hymenobacter siberiensis]
MSPTTPGASAATVATPAKPNKKERLPTSQLALATLGTAAAKAWLAAELPALLFVSKAAFSSQAAAYAASLNTADEAGDGRSPQANRLKTLDKLITKNLGFVKGYLAEDHDEDGGEAYYAEFGIVREGKNFRLPTARTARALALGKLVAALTAHKYDKKKFGTAVWQPIATEYAQLAKESGELRGAASAAVGQKNALEAPLRVALGSLVGSIKANYPDEDAQRGVLRAFGFQKEVY